MSYIQITTRCNMMCDHCCYRCTPDGEDMSIETFQNALAFEGECVAIGGGEPTLHPHFWEIMGIALGTAEYVWLATNGTQTRTSLALAKMAKKGVIGCELSLDQFHEYSMVDEEVKVAFWALEHGIRDITRDGSQDPVRAGRYNDYRDEDEGRDECPCPEPMIKPNGDVMACGCEDAPFIGNVNAAGSFIEITDDYEYGECWKNQECFKVKEVI